MVVQSTYVAPVKYSYVTKHDHHGNLLKYKDYGYGHGGYGGYGKGYEIHDGYFEKNNHLSYGHYDHGLHQQSHDFYVRNICVKNFEILLRVFF